MRELKKIELDRIRFYRINLDYVKYLWNYDNRVQYNKDESDFYNKRRPYIGIVLKIGGFQYFAPLEHPRQDHRTLKNNPHILKINNGRHGLIAFNNMIPVKDSELIAFDFKDEEPRYQKLLVNQFIFCDNNKKRIINRARDTYNKVTIQREPFFVKICCNFKLLEKKCVQYRDYLESMEEIAFTREIKGRNTKKDKN
mgnify:CR=1 FL=1